MRIVADCWIEADGRILLVKAGYRDFWQFPGGHAENGETPYQTAVREVREEIGQGVQVTRLLALNVEINSQGQPDTMCFLFAGFCDRETKITLQAQELSEFAWVPVGEAISRLHPLSQQLFPHAQSALKNGYPIYCEGGNVR